MSEQQRLLLAVTLSAGIFLLWSAIFPPPVPVEPELPVGDDATAAQEAPPAPSIEQPAKAQPTDSQETPAPTLAEAPVRDVAPPQLWSFQNNGLEGTLRDLDASLQTLSLRNYTEKKSGETERTPITLSEVRQGRLVFNKNQNLQLRLVDPQKGLAKLHGETSDWSVDAAVRLEADDYTLSYEVTATNTSGIARPFGFEATLGLVQAESERGWFSPPTDQIRGLCQNSEDQLNYALGDLDEAQTLDGITWAALDRQYFLVAVSVTDAGYRCRLSRREQVLELAMVSPETRIEPGASHTFRYQMFAGPKRTQALRQSDPRLTDAIDYSAWGIPLGFLARPMVFLMNMFQGWTGSWGVAIILLTVMVKLLLYPLTVKSMMSMRRMQELRPKMEVLQKKYANDKEKQQLEQMKLFRENGVNPLGGCLPMLLQMPVWLALYRTLWTAVDLYQQPFLWLPDLTAPEPLPVLALLLGGLIYVQQKLTPMATDSQQAKMMLYMMPIMMTVFMVNLPSGLVLYILVNTVLTIVQQAVINRSAPIGQRVAVSNGA